MVNPNWVLSFIFTALKPFIPQKTLDKIRFIENRDLPGDIEHYVDLEDLPVEYGGYLDEEY